MGCPKPTPHPGCNELYLEGIEARAQQGFSAQISLLTHTPPDSSHRVKGSLKGLITSSQSRQASPREEGRASGRGCASADTFPPSCLQPSHPASRTPHLDSSFLPPGTSAPGTALLGAGAAPLLLRLLASRRRTLEQGEKTFSASPRTCARALPFPETCLLGLL